MQFPARLPDPVYVFMAPAEQGEAFLDAHVGDGWTMPVWTVIDGNRVLWRWVGTHAGDRPDLSDIPTATRGAT